MEGILGPNSNLIGRSLKELNFRQRFGVLILAVHRKGRKPPRTLRRRETRLRGHPPRRRPVDKMNALFAEKDFVNLSRPKTKRLQTLQSAHRSRRPRSLPDPRLSLPHSHCGAALASVLLVLFTRCLDTTEAYRAVEWKVVFMIFGMLGLGLGLQQTQVVSLLAESMAGQLQQLGPYAVLAIVYLAAAVLTEIISNNAVAALLTPVALGIAHALNLDPRPFNHRRHVWLQRQLLTPIGYQTNTYVYGAGGYRFGDFGRVGIPLTILLWIVATFLIPLYWPFISMEN